ncbi:hypothetical protein UFOVP112_146 [uncultured Caudovirales phage]|uniref:Uncharacterized protein n=1 Tax=uncultured Caudovirales phage TaxID=2100421 RepID=A0A6J5L2U8_9CAUD|nr:hypothetical protein UFOVP112_146 [uncultured Caudovirales phage]
MATLIGTTVAENYEQVVDSQGLGARTQVINIAKTNITKAQMLVAVKNLSLVYTIAGVDGFLADETADNVRVALQGTIDYTPVGSNAFGISGAVTTLIADFDQK